MEVTIANCHDNSFNFAESKKECAEFKRNVEFSKNLTKEAMSIFKLEPIWITKRPKLEKKRKGQEASYAKKSPREEISIL